MKRVLILALAAILGSSGAIAGCAPEAKSPVKLVAWSYFAPKHGLAVKLRNVGKTIIGSIEAEIVFTYRIGTTDGDASFRLGKTLQLPPGGSREQSFGANMWDESDNPNIKKVDAALCLHAVVFEDGSRKDY